MISLFSLKLMFVWTLLVALLFGGSLLLTFWGMDKLINLQIKHDTALKQGTDQWDRFVELPFPIIFTVRFFEPLNRDGILSNTEKIILNETEPYSYMTYVKKDEFRYDDDEEDSINYRRIMSFEFDNSTGMDQADEVTIVNPLLLSSLQIASDIERPAMAGCLEKILKPDLEPKIFIKVQVDKLLFAGLNFAFANDTELGVACALVRHIMLDSVGNLRNIEHVPGEGDGNDYLRFSIFNYKTENYVKENPDGRYTINRGQVDLNQLGNIIRWNGKKTLDIWGTKSSINNETCQTMRGTDSTIYRPLLKEHDMLYVYNTDICRTVYLEYKSSNESYNGIPGFRYQTPSTMFKSSTENPENDCYCTKATKDFKNKRNCYLNGVFDFKPCIGSPILVSQPHFLNADSSYLDNIVGLSPDEDLHGIYLIIEPNTGTPLKARKRTQLNAVLKKQFLLSSITPKNMTEAIVPFLWLEESIDLPQHYVDLLQKQYFNKVKLARRIIYGLIAVTAVMLAICLFFLLRKIFFTRKEKN